jgi:hypothetical protein
MHICVNNVTYPELVADPTRSVNRLATHTTCKTNQRGIECRRIPYALNIFIRNG